MLKKHALLLGLFALLVPVSFLVQPGRAQAQADAASQDAASQNAAPSAETSEVRVFDVKRDGDKIGAETVTITKNGDTTTVKFKTHVRVVVMFVEAYHFIHSGVETWSGGKFVSYHAVTDDNGKHYNITAVAKDDQIALTVNGEHSKLPGDMVIASLWNKDFVGQTTMVHPDSGVQLAVKVKDLGDEQIDFQGQKIQAHHYEISGDLSRDIWFDGDKLIRIQLLGADHSTITSDLATDKTD